MKKFIGLFLAVVLVLSLAACSDVPFNGDIEFNDIALTIPENFVRDSTQSNENFWVFERNGYAEYILISRSFSEKEEAQVLENYVEKMRGIGAESEIVSFSGKDAVLSKYNKDNTFCQEILFPHNGDFYAVALRGGTEESFKSLIGTISLIERVEAE